MKVTFPTSNNLNLIGIWHYPKNNLPISENKVVILVHGITVDKDEGGVFIELANFLTQNNFTVFRFDFRGSGESEGKSQDMTIADEIKDLAAVINYVSDQGFENINLLAASFGASIASFYAAKNQNDLKTLCLWNPVLNYEHTFLHPLVPTFKPFAKTIPTDIKKYGFAELGRRKFKIGKKLYEEWQTLKPYEQLSKINIPTLIVHADTDTYVPYSDSKEYINNFKNGKLITIKNGEHGFHGDENGQQEAYEATLKFLEQNS